MNNVIEINNISFKYNKKNNIFENFSLKINSAETTFLTGKNGCGKTTLVKLIMGILKPQSGNINIFGQNTSKISLGQSGELIGYVFQNSERQFFSKSVLEELTFPLLFKGMEEKEVYNRAEEMLKFFGLEGLEDRYPFLLSTGEKKRLAIASVLMNKPKYLILDEPTACLDKKRIDDLSDILNKLKSNNIGILIISHNKEFINCHAERIIKLDGGKIIDDYNKN